MTNKKDTHVTDSADTDEKNMPSSETPSSQPTQDITQTVTEPKKTDASKTKASDQKNAAKSASTPADTKPENASTKNKTKDTAQDIAPNNTSKDNIALPALSPQNTEQETTPKIQQESKQEQEPKQKPEATHNNKPKQHAETTEPTEITEKNRHPLVKWIFLMVLIICTLAIIAAIAYGFHYVYTHMSQKIDTLQNNVAALENSEQGSTSALNQKLVALEKNNQQIRTQNAEQEKTINALNNRIDSAEQRLASQRKRILSMSTVSRDDWLLAEAEYLIKLANQRMLVERNAQGASALLVEADTILKDLDDPDLFPVRQQLAKDIANVRLIEKIDVEGLFLKLNALAESINQLPLNPTWQQRGELLNDELLNDDPQNQNAQITENAIEPTQDPSTFKEKAAAGFHAFTDKLDDYIRVRRHDTDQAQKLLIASPAQAEYLKQNLQLMLERASLALLREQQSIFDNSLDQAKKWLNTHFPESSQRAAFIAQIDEAKNTNVIQTLPDITQSLEALKAYMNELFALKNTANQKGSN